MTFMIFFEIISTALVIYLVNENFSDLKYDFGASLKNTFFVQF